jgi:hypothetical protein
MKKTVTKKRTFRRQAQNFLISSTISRKLDGHQNVVVDVVVVVDVDVVVVVVHVEQNDFVLPNYLRQ